MKLKHVLISVFVILFLASASLFLISYSREVHATELSFTSEDYETVVGGKLYITGVSDDSTDVVCSVSDGEGTVTTSSNAGEFTCEYSAVAPAGDSVVRVTSVSDPSVFIDFSVLVVPIDISIDPQSVTVPATNQVEFSVDTNEHNGVRWSVEEDGGSSIGAGTFLPCGGTGMNAMYCELFVATSTPGVYHVRVTSLSDSSKYDTSTVTVTPAPITVNNSFMTFYTGELASTTLFGVSTNDPLGLAWTPTDFFSIPRGSSGYPLFIAPSTPGIYYLGISNVSNSDQQVGIVANVLARPTITVSVSPSSAITTLQNNTVQFSATVSGYPSQNVVWSTHTDEGCPVFAPTPGVTIDTCRTSGTVNQNGLYTSSNGVGKDYVCADSEFDVEHGFILVQPGKSHFYQSHDACVPVDVSEGATYTGGSIGYYNAYNSAGGGAVVINLPIKISPATTTVMVGKKTEFTAIFSGNYSPVVWSLKEGSLAGTIYQKNQYAPLEYTASTTTGTYHLMASSTVGVAEAIITVIPDPTLALTPTSTPATTTPVVPAIKPVVTVAKLQGGSRKAVVVPSVVPATTAVPLTTEESDSGGIVGTAQRAIVTVGRFATRATNVTVSAIQTPQGAVVTQTVTTVGAATAVGSLMASPLFASPLSMSEIFLVPLRLWGLALSALGLRRKKKPWGTVYDSVTKRPIDPAFVALYDEHGKEVAASITDMDGRFGFFVPKGIYYLKVKKSNYIFPSKKLLDKSSDDVYHNLYFGEKIEVSEDDAVIYKNIPMDQENFDWNEFAKSKMTAMRLRVWYSKFVAGSGNFIFWFGFVVAFISIFAIPHIYSFTIFFLYILLMFLRFMGLKPKAFGTITDHVTHQPIPFATISVFSESLHQELFTKVADQFGRYYILVPKGEYEIKIAKKNHNDTYTKVYENVFNATKGVINKSIRV